MQNEVPSKSPDKPIHEEPSGVPGRSNDGDIEDEEEEILIEPRFKYNRILNDLPKMMENDGASFVAIHDKFIAVGCQSGRICIFDQLGNAQMHSTARHHTCSVTCISIESSGAYFASCANDFTVSIFGIGSNEYNHKVSLRFSARVVVVAEDFSQLGSGQKFIVGERDLTMYDRSFLGRRKSTVLFQGKERDGFLTAASWHGPYIAFTNESGTRIYDCATSKTITLIQPLHKMEMYYSSKFQPRHAWLNASTLAVGWANTVCICEIIVKKTDKSVHKQGQLVYRWILPDFYIGGISFTPFVKEPQPNIANNSASPANNSAAGLDFGHESYEISCKEPRPSRLVGWREIVVFGIQFTNIDDEPLSKLDGSRSCLSDGSATTTMTTAMLSRGEVRPRCTQLILLQPLNIDDYQLVAEETIEMRQVSPKNLGRFMMGALSGDNLYYLVGPREIIEAKPCSIDDRINWLIETGSYYKALNCALINRDSLKETSITDVGRHLVLHLMERREFETAARLLPTICAGQKQEWEFYVGEFEKARQILRLFSFIPVSDPQLEPECYESILTVALYSSPNIFLNLILQWNGDLYRVGFIRDKTIGRIADKGPFGSANDGGNVFASSPDVDSNPNLNPSVPLSKDDVICLYKVLAHLYVYERDFCRALEIYLLLRDPSIFGVIERHNVFGFVQDRVVELMEINTDLTIRLLLDNENSLPSKSVVNSLSNYPKLQIAYLNKLFNRGEGSEYSDLMVRLYAEHDQPKLLPFLRKSEHYRLDKALTICRRRNLVEEKIFLLGRSGNRIEALEEIILNLNRIELAIEFCKEHGETDEELWDRLIELAIKKPDHVLVLLAAIGTLIDDPIKVVEKIPSDIEIVGLREALMRIFDDATAHEFVYEQCVSAAANDLNGALREFVASQSVFVDPSADLCAHCSSSLSDHSKGNRSDISAYFCNHKFHDACIEQRRSLEASSFQTTVIIDYCPLCSEQEQVESTKTPNFILNDSGD